MSAMTDPATPLTPEWPHRKAYPTAMAPDTCSTCAVPWPCPSQQYLDALVAAAKALADGVLAFESGHVVEMLASEVRLILEGARATDDEGRERG